MNHLIQLAKNIIDANEVLPFSVYSSVKVQHILNVPITKPLLIFVLDGEKNLGNDSEIVCPSGNFVFLSNSPTINMRNIPQAHEYFAVLIDFDTEDFKTIQTTSTKSTTPQEYCMGEIGHVLVKTLEQFLEWSAFAPMELWSLRKRELLHALYHLGYDIHSLLKTSSMADRLRPIIRSKLSEDIHTDTFCEQLAMSESTLRRKLKAEGTSLQDVKDQIKLGHGLHLIQTTNKPIGLIADECGYQSQSRFTDRFKLRFGITPSNLRKTRMPD